MEEKQYLNLLQNVLVNGHDEETRNGPTRSLFGSSMRFSLSNGTIPILTTKKMAWKTCLKELLWFIGGNTDNRLLKEQGVHIWDANASSEFRQSVGLDDYQEDLLGPIYGWQWRHFDAPYDHLSEEMSKKYKDQLQEIIDTLKNPATRTSRRMVMTAWNPNQLKEMVLPPCHMLCQFHVHHGNQLSCAMYQRSADLFLGKPFNIASYAFLTHLLAAHCGLEAYELICFDGNVHLYEPHREAVETQCRREPYPFPTLSIRQVHETIEEYTVDDFIVNNYQCHEPISAKMIA
jgi:thymidylate synthase